MDDNLSLYAVRKYLESNQDNLISFIEQFVQKIKSQEDLNVFLEIFSDEVRASAKNIQQKIVCIVGNQSIFPIDLYLSVDIP